MNLIYLHGLDSDANATKGKLLSEYCQQHYPSITVIRPDLNMSPPEVVKKVTALINESPKETLLVGSSLGGYFATYLSNQLDTPALLINPSIQPHISLQRFSDSAHHSNTSKDHVIYTTSGGWQMTQADLEWFAAHPLTEVTYPKRVCAVIKSGDELLDAQLSAKFYQKHGAQVIIQTGGDHRFSDFAQHLPTLLPIMLA
ncbi:YqiA/YcfP family alpha/beta fold hydrolase [Psychrobacter aestuarii]|uniref:Alpha/beta fold hydrolase n=1 Tax=Psychrobacter aestuarii TaxID=556327 RepID=A0ABN0VJA8_9GAMM|nr:YqiA/YcfP family alpha/beta fold hydrolase [Psychrobacter aestuarii]